MKSFFHSFVKSDQKPWNLQQSNFLLIKLVSLGVEQKEKVLTAFLGVGLELISELRCL